MKIGIIKEGKIPIDRRVPLLPEECQTLKEKYPEIDILIQSSDIRCVPDEAYRERGFQVVDDVRECEVLLGVKEVPVDQLIADKTYFFFSHTIKKQEYNRTLLQQIVDKNIQLIDYECITNEKGSRVIAFGRFAGIVGAYNSLWAFGKKNKLFDLKRAYECTDLNELYQQLKGIDLPPIKIIITGTGRVGGGAVEVMEVLGIQKVDTDQFLNVTFDRAVFVQLSAEEYNKVKENAPEGVDFYSQPEYFESAFLPFAKKADLFISGHYWDPKAPVLFTKEDVKGKDFNIQVIGDVTCDIEGSIPTTLRATTIEEPIYDYDPESEKEVELFSDHQSITIMSVDNLPCELPLDASRSFGQQMIRFVIPQLFNNDEGKVLERAMITSKGKLMPDFEYLADFLRGK